VRARKARRIVFSIALSRQPLPALLFFKLIEVETKFPFANSISAFHAAKTHNGSLPHAWPVLTTKVAFVPALRAGQETSRAATWPRSEWDAVEPFGCIGDQLIGGPMVRASCAMARYLVVRTTRQFAIIFGGMTCAFSRRWLRCASKWCLPRLLNGKMELNSRDVSLSHLLGLLRREIHEDE
jgi:hypothetical protein